MSTVIIFCLPFGIPLACFDRSRHEDSSWIYAPLKLAVNNRKLTVHCLFYFPTWYLSLCAHWWNWYKYTLYLFHTYPAPYAIQKQGMPLTNVLFPQFGGPPRFEFPECPRSSLIPTVDEYQDLFRNSVGFQYIRPMDPPICVPPQRIPAHYREEVERQIQDMLSRGVTEDSRSPRMATTSGEIGLCVDYQELNKQTTMDAYRLPLSDKGQERQLSSTVFSTLDFQRGY